MHFLNPCSAIMRHTDMHVRIGNPLTDRTTVLAGQRNDAHVAFQRGIDRRKYIR